jgi:hypothetical protein
MTHDERAVGGRKGARRILLGDENRDAAGANHRQLVVDASERHRREAERWLVQHE